MEALVGSRHLDGRDNGHVDVGCVGWLLVTDTAEGKQKIVFSLHEERLYFERCLFSGVV